MSRQESAGPPRRLLQSFLVVGSLALLALPPVAVTLSGTAGADPLWTFLRLVGLEAFTILLLNLVVGAYRPLLARLTRPRPLQRLHLWAGTAAFALAVSHGLSVFLFGIPGYPAYGVWIGPGVLAALLVTVASALLRTRLARYWRHLHRLNYALFLAALVHAVILGSDIRSNHLLLSCALLYGAVAAGGFAFRLLHARRSPGPARPPGRSSRPEPRSAGEQPRLARGPTPAKEPPPPPPDRGGAS